MVTIRIADKKDAELIAELSQQTFIETFASLNSKENMDKFIKDNRIWFGTSGDNMPRLKRFLTEVKDGITPLTIWYRKDVGDNQEAKRDLLNIMPENVFQTPKSIRLIKRMLSLSANDADPVSYTHLTLPTIYSV